MPLTSEQKSVKAIRAILDLMLPDKRYIVRVEDMDLVHSSILMHGNINREFLRLSLSSIVFLCVRRGDITTKESIAILEDLINEMEFQKENYRKRLEK